MKCGIITSSQFIKGLKKQTYDKFHIKDVAEYIGCCTKTLKNAEKDGRIPAAKRESNGYRVYSIKDVENIASELIGDNYKFVLGEFPYALYSKRLNKK